MYVATINVPGYLPMDDDPPIFDTAREAWDYLADERTRHEDEAVPDEEDYSRTRDTLGFLGDEAQERGGYLTGPDGHWVAFGLAPDGTGSIHGGTPGYDGDHDLGLAYSVSEVES